MEETMRTFDVRIPAETVTLEGELVLPGQARGLVLFAHGSGSSRHSPRNQYVARVLHEAGLATLLLDLLTAEEEQRERYTRHLRFDIPFLAARLVQATRWVARQRQAEGLALGYFGSSTGAAAALVAAAELEDQIRAVVSRGGRPDLAEAVLVKVTAPVLLIVGGHDLQVLELNESAYAQVRSEKLLKVIPGATHLFEEQGALERVSRLAADWFARHLHHVPATV
jgi:putative phosphoribosyl transferase